MPPPRMGGFGKADWMDGHWVGRVICPGAGEGLLGCTREDCTAQSTRSQTITPVDDRVPPGLEKATRGIAVTRVACRPSVKILNSANF